MLVYKEWQQVLFKNKILYNSNVWGYFLPSYSNTKKVLENLGFSVDIAENSEYLINKIKYGEKYDIIFSNNIYKDGTGSDCLKKLKEIKVFSTPVIIHTVEENERDYFVNQIGFDDCIIKSITVESILPVLEKIFGKNSL